MKKQALVKPLLVLSMIVTALLVAFGSINVTKGLNAAPRSATQRARAADTRPLKEKAKETGRYVRTEEPASAPQYQGMENVSNLSSAVIIGTAQSNACRLSADGKKITIDYKVKVQDVLKGNLKTGEIVTVSLPGGRISFEDGTTAEVRTPWFKKMENGKTYVLFLTGGDQGVFVTTGGPQGVYGMSEGEEIKTHSGRLKDPMWKYSGMGKDAFLEEVRKTVKKTRG